MKQRMMSLFVALAFGGAALHAMDVVEQQPAAPEESTVKKLIGNTLATGEVITEKTLPALAAKYSPISKEDDEKVKRWLENPDNLRLLMIVTQIPKERTYEALIADKQATEKAFQASGTPNLSRWNIAFPVDPKDPSSPIIKVSGKRAIIFGLVASQQNPHAWINEKKPIEGNKAFSTFPFEKTNDVTTHQTTSRQAHWLRARERASKRFVIPAEHLYPIPGKDKEGHDGNYFIVEKPLKNAVCVSKLSDDEQRLFWSKVPPETLTDLCEIISYASLWDACGNLLAFRDETGALNTNIVGYTDFEQPDNTPNTKPSDFFYQNTDKYVGDALNGIGEIRGQINKYAPDRVPLFGQCFKTVLDERYPEFRQAIIDAKREADIEALCE